MNQKLDTKRLADTLVGGAVKYIDKQLDGRLRSMEDRLLALETLLAAGTIKAAKPVVRIPAGKSNR
jgi:hypothetical protein